MKLLVPAIWMCLLLLLWAPEGGLGQSCQSAGSFLPPFCAELGLNYSVHVAAGSSLLISQMFAEATIGPLLITDKQCQAAGVAVLCSAIFAPCISAVNSSFLLDEPLPQHVCRSSCERFRGLCPLYTDSINCGAEQFGDEPRTFSFVDTEGYNVTLVLPCWKGLEDYKGPFPFAECPYPLITETSSPSCGKPCEVPLWSEWEWDTFREMYQVLGWITFFASTALLASNVLNPLKRNVRDNLVTFLALGLWLKAFTLSWGSSYGFHEMRCNNEGGADFQSSPCVAFSVFYVWSNYITTTWWLNICINLLLIVVFNQPMEVGKWRLIGYHVWGWGFGVLMLILLGANDLFGSGDENPICNLVSKLDEVDETDGLIVGFYYVPLMLMLLVGIGMLVAVLISIARSSGWKGVQSQWRVMTAILIIVVTYVFPITIYFIKLSDKNNGVEDGVAYFQCIFTAENAANDCASVSNIIPFGLELTNVFMDGSSGLWIVLVFAVTRSNFCFWRTLFITGILKGELKSVVASNSSSSSSERAPSPAPTRQTKRTKNHRRSVTMEGNVMVTVVKMEDKTELQSDTDYEGPLSEED
ncbi:hypothetical protein QOT17_016818 [Balamuthia mandrillaris]